ncbi:uncharacterized protein METZ01_LOCUS514941 [marine metagenome]|uniref:Uncharacterized protein n=1 Tax=marine metagenome TaxID=408172 RepID=A0A383EYW9_9ZZZZ
MRENLRSVPRTYKVVNFHGIEQYRLYNPPTEAFSFHSAQLKQIQINKLSEIL